MLKAVLDNPVYRVLKDLKKIKIQNQVVRDKPFLIRPK